MKKIMHAGITYNPYGDLYCIDAEHSEAEYGEEWDGNVLGYADNALNGDWDDYTISKELPDGINLDYGYALGSNFIFILNGAGKPVECYWLAY